MSQNLNDSPSIIMLPKPAGLYQFYTAEVTEIEPRHRFEMLATNIKPYVIEVVKSRQSEQINTVRRTVLGEQGENFSAMEALDKITFDPQRINPGSLFISLLLQGTVEITGNRQTDRRLTTKSSLMLYERTRLPHCNSENGKQLYLILPCSDARIALGGSLGEQAFSLDAHPLAPFIRSQMLLLDTHGAGLHARATANILDGLYNMSLLMLAEIGKALGYRHDGAKNFIFSAAKRYIEQHYAEQDLTPDTIAIAVRCSRSALDRACLEQHTSVMKVLQEVRLHAAKYRLENYPEERIDTIAWLCGFSSPSILSKLFKVRFGLSPKVWRKSFMGGPLLSSASAGQRVVGE